MVHIDRQRTLRTASGRQDRACFGKSSRYSNA
nr:MAG TPA: hypothetical protein [Caudoviricetes sp.]